MCQISDLQLVYNILFWSGRATGTVIQLPLYSWAAVWLSPAIYGINSRKCWSKDFYCWDFIKTRRTLHKLRRSCVSKEKLYVESILSPESCEMNALWPNDSLTFAWDILNWTDFVTDFVTDFSWSKDQIRKWQNNCFVTKWQLNFYLSLDILK